MTLCLCYRVLFIFMIRNIFIPDHVIRQFENKVTNLMLISTQLMDSCWDELLYSYIGIVDLFCLSNNLVSLYSFIHIVNLYIVYDYTLSCTSMSKCFNHDHSNVIAAFFIANDQTRQLYVTHPTLMYLLPAYYKNTLNGS